MWTGRQLLCWNLLARGRSNPALFLPLCCPPLSLPLSLSPISCPHLVSSTPSVFPSIAPTLVPLPVSLLLGSHAALQPVTAVLQSLTPPQLAGVLGAILTSENISKPQIWVAYEPSAQVVDAIQALEADREQLYKVQVQHGVQAPLAIDLRLAGITLLVVWCVVSTSLPGITVV